MILGRIKFLGRIQFCLVEAEFPKFVTTYDEAYRIIEKYQNSSTSKFVLWRKNKEFGNEGEMVLYIFLFQDS